MRKIPFHKSSLGSAEVYALSQVLKSGWLTKGPRTKAFEKEFARFIKSPYTVGVNSCTAGLHLALCALGVGRGDEVITTPLTFAATANVIEHVGARVRFADVDEQTGNISLSDIERRLTKKTRAIIVVHLAGYPCEMKEIVRFCRRKRLFLIEDAAHGLGGSLQGKALGTWGDVGAFSFYATKNITTGEGGMVATQQKKIAERIAQLSLHGLSRDAWKRYMPSRYMPYTVNEPGFKYNMFDIQAALGMEQLKKIKRFMRERTKLWRLYNHLLSSISEIAVPPDISRGVHARHLYMITLNTKKLTISRDQMIDALQKKGIMTQVHFISLHMQPYYKKKYGYVCNDFPHAYHLSKTLLSLPLYPGLSQNAVSYICTHIRKIIQQYRK